jgi:hypothetical protein
MSTAAVKSAEFKALPEPKTVAEFSAVYMECLGRAAVEKINKRPEHEAHWRKEAKQAADFMEYLRTKKSETEIETAPVPGVKSPVFPAALSPDEIRFRNSERETFLRYNDTDASGACFSDANPCL